jgi:hypothetical protein
MNSNKEILKEKEYTILNLGPTHPATHGIFQNVMKMDNALGLMLCIGHDNAGDFSFFHHLLSIHELDF